MSKIRIWISKYAITQGISVHEVDDPAGSDHPNIIQIPGDSALGTFSYYVHGEGKDWHRTSKSALENAEAKRVAKIKSLERALVALKRMTFKAPP